MSYSQRILLSFLIFGLIMGVVFPFYAILFVEIKQGMALYFIISTILAGLLVGIFNYTIYRIIIGKVLKKLSNTFSEVSKGNLKVECKIKSKDEIGKLSLGINKMVKDLRKLIEQDLLKQVHDTGKQVAYLSKSLSVDAEEITRATNRVSNMIREVALGAENQLERAEESSVSMHQVTEGIDSVAQKTAIVSELSKRTADGAIEGNKSIQQAIVQMDLINDSVNQSSRITKLLGERIKEINDIVTVITNIATETNLLAINAAIEAARAGENGRGFSVVADHVMLLAEQSKLSAGKIATLIKEIQEYRGMTITSMDNVTNEVKEGITIINVAGESFEEIVKAANEVATEIQEISILSDDMSSNSEEIAVSIDDMTEIARKSAANAQSVAASSEEQLMSMKEISYSAERLGEMAEELDQIIGKFNL